MNSALLVALLLAHPDLDEGRVAVAALKYRAAVPALQRVTRDPAASESDVAEAWLLLGRSQFALQKPDLAQAAFEALLQLRPLQEEPTGSPALRAVFNKAKSAVFPPKVVRLKRRASPEDALVVEILNPWRLPLVVSWHPVPGAADTAPRALTIDDDRVMMALVPGAAGWVHVESNGEVLAELGSAAAPIRGPAPPEVAVAPPPPPPVRDAPRAVELAPSAPAPTVLPPEPRKVDGTRRALGWTLAGVGLATTAVGVGLAAGGTGDLARANNWVFEGITLDEANRLEAQGRPLQVGGFIVGGLGLTALISGIVILLKE
ncbi:MAG: tetratricopeptide repeat protein [Myxococcaceae bacterium]